VARLAERLVVPILSLVRSQGALIAEQPKQARGAVDSCQAAGLAIDPVSAPMATTAKGVSSCRASELDAKRLWRGSLLIGAINSVQACRQSS
jgi:hypothetical protein